MEMSPELREALARNEARRVRPAWIAEFARLTGHAIVADDFLSLLETTELRDVFFECVKRRQDIRMEEWNGCSRAESLEAISGIGSLITLTETVLFSQVDRLIGAVRVPPSPIFRHAEELLCLLDRDIYLMTLDSESGFCFEFDYYSAVTGEYESRGLYRLSTWGEFGRAHDASRKP